MTSPPVRRAQVLRVVGSALCIAAALAATAAAQPQVNQLAPDCAFTLAGQPGRTDLRQYRGKVVYLDFWASWCGPCAISFPFMNLLQREDRARGLQVIAVDMDRTRQDAERFLTSHPANFAVALDGNEKCARDFGVAGMPTSYLIDRNGVIRQIHTGFRQGEAGRLRGLVEKVIGETSATTAN